MITHEATEYAWTRANNIGMFQSAPRDYSRGDSELMLWTTIWASFNPRPVITHEATEATKKYRLQVEVSIRAP